MPVELLLALIAAIPIVMIVLLRSNAAIVYLSLCAGVVLQNLFGADAHLILDAIMPRASSVYGQALDIVLVTLPAALASIMLRKKAKGLRFVLGIIPAICAGLLVVLSIVNFISPLTRDAIYDSTAWRNLNEFRGLVALLGVVSSIALLKPSKKHEEGHKKHHK